MKSNNLYQLKKGAENSTKIEIAVHAAIFIIITAIGFMCCIGIYSNEGIESAVGFVLAFLVCIGIFMFFSVKKLRETIRCNSKKVEYINAFDSRGIDDLESEIEKSDFLYGTFYLLDEYLYAPKSRLIIKYQNITEFKNIIHSTNGLKDGMMIAVTDTSNLLYEIRVKHWKDYYKHCGSITEFINDKRKKLIL